MASGVSESSSPNYQTVPCPADSPLKEIRFTKGINPMLDPFGKISLFFRSEELLRQFDRRKIQGFAELCATCTEKRDQNQEFEIIFIKWNQKINPYDHVDQAIAAITKHYGFGSKS